MRVLIIGCGYVGVPLGAKLARAGHEVHGLRRSSAAVPELSAAGITPIVADITRPETLDRRPAAYDWVVLCAASAGGGAADYRRVYLEGSQNVLEWLAPSAPRKLVYTSSTSVYGQTDGSLVDETSPAEPATETAQVLLQTEALWVEAARQGELPAVVLRLAGIYGPSRGYWLKQYLKGEASIEGRGERFLNMIHRDDVVGAVESALQAAQPGEIFNVVDNEPVRLLDYFQWLSQRLGGPLPPFIPEGSGAARKRGATNKRVSNAKLTHQLDCHLKYPTFREGHEVEIPSLCC